MSFYFTILAYMFQVGKCINTYIFLIINKDSINNLKPPLLLL